MEEEEEEEEEEKKLVFFSFIHFVSFVAVQASKWKTYSI
jgi:hypothetical protein